MKTQYNEAAEDHKFCRAYLSRVRRLNNAAKNVAGIEENKRRRAAGEC